MFLRGIPLDPPRAGIMASNRIDCIPLWLSLGHGNWGGRSYHNHSTLHPPRQRMLKAACCDIAQGCMLPLVRNPLLHLERPQACQDIGHPPAGRAATISVGRLVATMLELSCNRIGDNILFVRHVDDIRTALAAGLSRTDVDCRG